MGSITPKPLVWLPTPIHPLARAYADSVFDVLTPQDPRANDWPDLCVAAVVRTGKLTEDELRRADKLRIITRNGVGLDMIPLDICKEKDIRVTHLPGSNAKAVAELAFGLALSLMRRIVEFDRRLRRGEILPSIYWMADTLDDKVVGCVGMGIIAYHTAKKFHYAFDCPILVYSPTSSLDRWTDKDPNGLAPIPHIRVNSLEDLLKQADVISLHCPLNKTTANMMSTEQFAMMKQSAVLINTGRGGLVDEDALMYALKNGVIAGAGLDVLVHEPASAEVYSELFALENVVVLPHAGGGTDKVQVDSCMLAVKTAEDFLNGVPGFSGSTVVV
ncbi:hypothetical protein MNV49_002100 [Pseudohyphozyma bogoriensis]|nr:hypothetical protein MNV49_002100 [Pseudohyphozyma bogoriensis]